MKQNHLTFNIKHYTVPVLPFPSRNHHLLQRLPILPRRQSNGRPGGTGTNTSRPARDLATEVALHGHGLLDLLFGLREERRHPSEQIALRLFVHHEDVAVGAVALAVAAADAVALDVDLAARIALDGIGRAVEHA